MDVAPNDSNLVGFLDIDNAYAGKRIQHDLNHFKSCCERRLKNTTLHQHDFFLRKIRNNTFDHDVADNRLLRAGGLGGTREAYTILFLGVSQAKHTLFLEGS